MPVHLVRHNNDTPLCATRQVPSMPIMRSTTFFSTVLCSCTTLLWTPAGAFLSSPLRVPRSDAGHEPLLLSRRAVFPVPMMLKSTSDIHIHKDVVVIGGGLAGLSTALELAKRGRQVTVLSRSRSEAAAEAAGGMIAPQAERLESSLYLDLCLSSRAMYSEWVSGIEAIAGLGGEKAETHFWSCGGFLSPAFEGDAVSLWSPPPEGGQSYWIDRQQVRRVIHKYLMCFKRLTLGCFRLSF